jgi:hypothetical protein
VAEGASAGAGTAAACAWVVTPSRCPGTAERNLT